MASSGDRVNSYALANKVAIVLTDYDLGDADLKYESPPKFRVGATLELPLP
jgi:predicted nuclease of predicted toxin-antitoxin system